MSKLTDTQPIILSAASQRDDAKTYSIRVDLASIAIAALLIRARSKNLRLPCAQQAASMMLRTAG